MKHLKTFESLKYSGKDVTKMPIIGRILTKKMGSFDECIYQFQVKWIKMFKDTLVSIFNLKIFKFYL